MIVVDNVGKVCHGLVTFVHTGRKNVLGACRGVDGINCPLPTAGESVLYQHCWRVVHLLGEFLRDPRGVFMLHFRHYYDFIARCRHSVEVRGVGRGHVVKGEGKVADDVILVA